VNASSPREGKGANGKEGGEEKKKKTLAAKEMKISRKDTADERLKG